MKERSIRPEPAGWTPRLYRPGDERQILPLYPRAFQGLQRSDAYWQWKFHDNPAGQCVVVAEGPEGRVLGTLGGLPALVHAAGRTVIASQFVEAMVDPEIRHALRERVPEVVEMYVAGRRRARAGLFIALVDAVVEEVMTKRGAAFMFALPNQDSDGKHRRVGGRFFDQVTRVVRPLGGVRASPAAWLARARYRVRPVQRFGPESDWLWERCRPTFPLATVRDAEYLNWRYRDCPHVRYHPYLAWDRRRERPAGLVVLRMGWEGQPLCALVDWLVPRDDGGAAPALLACAEREARRAGMREVAAWFSPDSPEQQWFCRRGYRLEPTHYPMLVLAGPELPLDWIARHWYYTMGDSDIF